MHLMFVIMCGVIKKGTQLKLTSLRMYSYRAKKMFQTRFMKFMAENTCLRIRNIIKSFYFLIVFWLLSSKRIHFVCFYIRWRDIRCIVGSQFCDSVCLWMIISCEQVKLVCGTTQPVQCWCKDMENVYEIHNYRAEVRGKRKLAKLLLRFIMTNCIAIPLNLDWMFKLLVNNVDSISKRTHPFIFGRP